MALDQVLLSSSSLSQQEKNGNLWGKAILALSGGIAVGVTLIATPFLTPALRRICLPYVPATSDQISNILNVLKSLPKRKMLIDIGSGDGRIVFAASQYAEKAHGVELNPVLHFYAKFKSFALGCSHNVKFFRRDLWKFPLTPYDTVVIFGVEQMMEEFENKVDKELISCSYVVACRFPLPHKKPVSSLGSGVDTVWLYRFNNSKVNG